MNFSEAISETYNIDFKLYSVTETDPSASTWQVQPGSAALPGVTDADSAKAALLDYIRNGGDVPIGTFISVPGEEPSYKIMAVTPAVL
jgi:hypothetical protein